MWHARRRGPPVRGQIARDRQPGEEVMAFFLKLSGSDFRAYVHDPDDVERWIIDAGFKKTYQNKTFIWLTQLYQK